MNEINIEHLQLAIAVAWQARNHGNHPFGAVLVDTQDRVLLQAENTVNTGSDCTGHAETNLVRMASHEYEPDFLATCTLYTSTEPCVMCSGAIYWSNIGRVVFGLSEARLRELTGDDPENPTLSLPCRDVFSRGRRPIQVIGPELAEEAERVHDGFWRQSTG